MTCAGNSCSCVGVNTLFDKKGAKKEYKRYLRKGAHKMTKKLIEALKNEDIQGKSLIDIGGGIGAIHHELLSAGVRKATNVDGSEAYIETSKEEGKRLHHEEKLTHHFGDYVEQSESVGQADIVTLDKVLCCYKDMRELVARSSSNAQKFYGLIYPNDTWWMKFFSSFANIFVRLKSKEFQSYIHDVKEVENIILGNGFKQRFYYKNFIWQVILYAK